MVRFQKTAALLAQVAICLLALSIAALSPPARGRMMMLSLSGGPGALRAALRNGAGLVGRGPVSGTVIIQGDLSRLEMPLAQAGAVLLAAPRGCGELAA